MTVATRQDTGTNTRRDHILTVALECFARYGVNRTRMEDIADEAGLSRPVLYLEFASRRVLIDAVMERQLASVVAETGPALMGMTSLAEAIVEGSVLLISALRNQQATLEILFHIDRGRLIEIVQGSLAYTVPYAQAIWRPVLAQARERGEIRAHLSDDDEIAAWISSVHVPYLVGAVTDYDKMRRAFYAFVVPAICIDGNASPRRASKSKPRTKATDPTGRRRGR
jgi:AcrR family transcriptional regulator